MTDDETMEAWFLRRARMRASLRPYEARLRREYEADRQRASKEPVDDLSPTAHGNPTTRGTDDMSDVMKLQQELAATKAENAELKKFRDEFTSNGQPNRQIVLEVGHMSQTPFPEHHPRTLDAPDAPHVEVRGMTAKGEEAERAAEARNRELREREPLPTEGDRDPMGVAVGPDAIDESEDGRPGLTAATKTREGEEAQAENEKAQARRGPGKTTRDPKGE